MSLSMFNMWVSILGMALLFIAFVTIYVSRFKLKNRVLKFFTTFIAYICLISGSVMMIYIVFSGPTS
ncbi:DUF2768 domain-containing protein [Bacillus chungangensis]|uniref:Flp pilus assembly protein TadB n=1 Tax=Bacillus chungangensis TaxID=587633 RepID=A0ABT9WSN4_9BACI|nr:DUF2768 domain-containing protein [Bacillus chungangensis]MDQ0176210.1 Flp pilus assembly protein TadB [Bacillus chungangensis]